MTKIEGTPPGGFYFTGERTHGGMRITVGSVVSVGELSCERVLLVTHTGKIEIEGEKLELSVFEGHSTEVKGRIEGVKFIYGKN